MEKMTLSDVFRMIGKDSYLYYRHKSHEVNTIQYYYEHYHRNTENSLKEEIGNGILDELIPLPRYDDIDHKSIMSFYVREFVEDKEKRRKLFNILRNHDYMDKFLAAVKELELYDEYIMVTDDIYIQLAEEWAENSGVLPVK